MAVHNIVVKLMITYAFLDWWPRMKQVTAVTRLGRSQRLVSPGIAGLMRTTPTGALWRLSLYSPLLHLVGFGKGRMAQFSQVNLPNYENKPNHMKPKHISDINLTVQITNCEE